MVEATDSKRTMEGGSKGGEVRRIHVIYFLSRMGHVEHPHLLRVHHQTRNGVYLRDVKRWLADLRGEEMPEAFAWSYKRRYKNGYVWQDLIDDGLITPVSDNEYVIKGSEIIRTTQKGDSPCREKKSWMPRDTEAVEQEQPVLVEPWRKSTSGIYKESPVFGSERSTTTDDSTIKEEEITKLNSAHQENDKKPDNSSSKYYHLLNKNRETSNAEKGPEHTGRSSVSSTSSSKSSTFTRSKSYSGGASQMFRSLMKCGSGGVETNDAVLVALNRPDKAHVGGSSARVFGTLWEDEEQGQQHKHTARKSFDGAWSGTKRKEMNEFCRPKIVSVASKPNLGPFCSQCGKQFKPEKMHSHMKSCRGMRALAKSAAASGEKTPSQRHENSPEDEEYATPRSSLVI